MKILEKSEHLVLFFATIALVWILLVVKNLVFRQLQTKRNDLKTRFLNHFSTIIVVIIGVILAFSAFGGTGFMWKSLLGGTAFFSAIVVFMAQDVIKDILAGLMISMYQPFEIGDRIVLEDGTAGVVDDVTMRHTVLKGIDTVRILVPNRRLADMILKNFSYDLDCRSVQFNFSIAYPSDVQFAINVIRREIIESKYTIPGKKTDHGMDYAPVYFMAFEDSSLTLRTVVYYDCATPTEAVITDINLRVDHALWENGIEIPYPHVNILQTPQETKDHRDDVISELMWRTPLIRIKGSGEGITDAMDATAELGEENGLTTKEIMRLRLLGEELVRMMASIVGDVQSKYWAEHKEQEYRIHISATVSMTKEMRKNLLSVSSTGKNSAQQSLMDKAGDMITLMFLPEGSDKSNMQKGMSKDVKKGTEEDNSFMWSMKQYKSTTQAGKAKAKKDYQKNNLDNLERSIVASIADDVRISINGFHVEIIAFKSFYDR